METQKGQIRIGRIVGKNKPIFDNFKQIVVLTASSSYGELGPYCLKDEHGVIMENAWQFRKCYERVPYSRQIYSRWDKTVIWEWPEEIHVDENGNLTKEYFKWREAGMNCKYPVRYPVGMKHRSKCIYLWDELNNKKLGYLESRKEIYSKIYCELVKKQPKYKKLQKMLDNGTNLLILEIDGPHEESLQYYKEKYNVDDNFIINNTILASKENLSIMLNDEKHPYGHGYCLAASLLGYD